MRNSLTAKDHERIMRLILYNHEQVLMVAVMGRDALRKTKKLSGVKILKALLEMEGIDLGTRNKIRRIVNDYPKLASVQNKIPSERRRSINYVLSRVKKARTVPQIIKVLREIKASGKFAQSKALMTGINVSIDMLKAGLSTIYSPEPYIYMPSRAGTKQLREKQKDRREALKDTVKLGVKDISGALSGAKLGPGGALLGAVVRSAQA